MSLLNLPNSSSLLVDCFSLLPEPFPANKRRQIPSDRPSEASPPFNYQLDSSKLLWHVASWVTNVSLPRPFLKRIPVSLMLKPRETGGQITEPWTLNMKQLERWHLIQRSAGAPTHTAHGLSAYRQQQVVKGTELEIKRSDHGQLNGGWNSRTALRWHYPQRHGPDRAEKGPRRNPGPGEKLRRL